MAEPGLQAQGVPAPNPPLSPADPTESQAPQQSAQPLQQVVHLNWSHFKSNFSGKPDEDAEAHLLCTKQLDECTSLCRRCQSPEISFNIVRRG